MSLTSRITTIELLAELQSREMRGLDVLMREAYQKAEKEARQRWIESTGKTMVRGLDSSWRMPVGTAARKRS